MGLVTLVGKPTLVEIADYSTTGCCLDGQLAHFDILLIRKNILCTQKEKLASVFSLCAR